MDTSRPIPDSYWLDFSVLEGFAGASGRVLAGEYPGAEERGEAERKLLSLLAAGVTTFLDLTEADEVGLSPYMPIINELAPTPIQHRRIAIQDMSTPTERQVVQALDFIDQATAGGHVVYVHCYGGIGRTGTVMGCYLARHGITGEQAIEQIALWRSGTPNGSRGSPETVDQRRLVRSWPAGK